MSGSESNEENKEEPLTTEQAMIKAFVEGPPEVSQAITDRYTEDFRKSQEEDDNN